MTAQRTGDLQRDDHFVRVRRMLDDDRVTRRLECRSRPATIGTSSFAATRGPMSRPCAEKPEHDRAIAAARCARRERRRNGFAIEVRERRMLHDDDDVGAMLAECVRGGRQHPAGPRRARALRRRRARRRARARPSRPRARSSEARCRAFLQRQERSPCLRAPSLRFATDESAPESPRRLRR